MRSIGQDRVIVRGNTPVDQVSDTEVILGGGIASQIVIRLGARQKRLVSAARTPAELALGWRTEKYQRSIVTICLESVARLQRLSRKARSLRLPADVDALKAG
jgi:hypothetical protein